VQNQQKNLAMRNLDGKLAGWDLPRDHFVIEQIPKVKCPQSYQATFGGTPGTAHMMGEGVVFVYFNHVSKNFDRFKISPTHAHMVIPTEKRLPIPPQRPDLTPPQRSAQQPILGMPVQTATQQQPTLGMPIQTALLQQSTTMQAVLIPATTVDHTRSSPQQPINQGAAGQPVFPQVDSAQLLQTLLNQLAISSQLSMQQVAPSANQPIEQVTPVAGHSNAQDSAEARTTPNPKSRILEEQPPETPAEMQAIEQVATKLKSHMKQELIDHFSEMLLKQYGIIPKQQSCMYRTPYPSGYDQIPLPPRFKVPDFTKFSGQDEMSTMEHITRFIIQCGECDNPTRDNSVLLPKPLHLVIKR
jgi:hypothetical protein